MFVSIYLFGYLKMREVKTREEAFGEMRRYMELNNIYSDVTVLSSHEFTDRFGTSETVEMVRMQLQSGYHRDEIRFGIHNRTCPDYASIDDALQNCSQFAYCYNQYKTDSSCKHSNRLSCVRYSSAHPSSRYYSWFPDEYERYVDDLQQRVGDACR